MSIFTRSAWALVALAVTLAACAAESGEPGGGVSASSPEHSGAAGEAAVGASEPASAPAFVSALPDESPVSSLAGVEWSTLCDELGAWTNDVFAAAPESTCLLGGLVLGGSPQGCETMVDSCLASADAPPPPACDASLQAGCTATIGEIETCLNQVVTVIGSLGGNVSCETTLDRSMLAGVLRPLTGATSCLSLQSTCPALSATVTPGM